MKQADPNYIFEYIKKQNDAYYEEEVAAEAASS